MVLLWIHRPPSLPRFAREGVSRLMASVIVISSDEEEGDAGGGTKPRQGGAQIDAPVLLDSDDESSAAPSGTCRARGLADEPVDLDSEEWIDQGSAGGGSSTSIACGICRLSPPVKQHILSGCAHLFCRSCLSR